MIIVSLWGFFHGFFVWQESRTWYFLCKIKLLKPVLITWASLLVKSVEKSCKLSAAVIISQAPSWCSWISIQDKGSCQGCDSIMLQYTSLFITSLIPTSLKYVFLFAIAVTAASSFGRFFHRRFLVCLPPLSAFGFLSLRLCLTLFSSSLQCFPFLWNQCYFSFRRHVHRHRPHILFM